jgi:hypothetical protein
MSEIVELPEGDLNELANDTRGAAAIGLMSILWVAWTAVSMLLPWQNSAFTNTWDPPITYIWTLTDNERVFYSWLPTGYFSAHVINPVLFFIELLAWWTGGEFFLLWAKVGLWGGLIIGAFPVVCEVLYIYVEYPFRQSGSEWNFIFWSAEFWMILMQGGLWLASFIVHAASIGPLYAMIKARWALDEGYINECKCDPCEFPHSELERKTAELICKAACFEKCPSNIRACPLDKKKGENDERYAKRCKTVSDEV